MATMTDNSSSWYGGATASLGLGILPAQGDNLPSQLEASLDEQRKRKKMQDSPSPRSMQMMPPATRDLLGGGGYGMGGT